MSAQSVQGTINYTPFFLLPFLPPIISEWTALIPLISHLASYHNDHQLIGKAAMEGRLRVSLFPRLGTLRGIAELLSGGPNFLDRLSSISEVSNNVWDINGGTTFPCANGAASEIITAYALHQQTAKVHKMPEDIPMGFKKQEVEKPAIMVLNLQDRSQHQAPSAGNTTPAGIETVGTMKGRSNFRRYQTLHVIEFGRQKARKKYGVYHTIDQLINSTILTTFSSLLAIGLVVLLCLCGLFGTAAVILTGTLTQIVCRVFKLERPPGFLENNETHKACMLLSCHKNANTWFLYVGDRGVVDSLLNKTMIAIPPAARVLSRYFRTAHFVQLLAMTYVAAQKGWDGLTLLLLVIYAWVSELPYQHNQMVRRWLEAEGVSVHGTSFEFTGRTPMLGAIHGMSGTASATWMDDILSPSPRRAVWLKQLVKGSEESSRIHENFDALSSFGKDWVILNSSLSIQAIREFQSRLGRETWA